MNIVCNGALPLKEMVLDPENTDPKDLIELTDTVIEAATAARGVTAELKGYAYQEHGGNKTVDINKVVQSTIKMFPKRGEGAKLVFEPSNDPVVVDCVPTRLTQVFTNLVKNAFEAMSWKGTVTIETLRDGANVIVRVTDTGPGVPESQRGKLFQPFHTTKKQGEGLGLGLSLSQKVIHDLGGSMQLDGNYTGGARFVIKLPAHGASTTLAVASDRPPAVASPAA
jgi:two-component system, NtrC family, C4-dicarboxylate transport sensor histidine kinase DctB